MIDHCITCDIGGKLQRARQQRGLTLDEASGRTKLPVRVLQAIERNDFESLPAGIYRKGYLRSLAGEVGLDPREIAADYDKAYEEPAGAAAANRTLFVEHDAARQFAHSPRRSVVTFVILLALAIGWLAGIVPLAFSSMP